MKVPDRSVRRDPFSQRWCSTPPWQATRCAKLPPLFFFFFGVKIPIMLNVHDFCNNWYCSQDVDHRDVLVWPFHLPLEKISGEFKLKIISLFVRMLQMVATISGRPTYNIYCYKEKINIIIQIDTIKHRDSWTET